MFEEEEISEGYGDPSALMPDNAMMGGADPMAAPAGRQESGSDPLIEGVQAFMETQDPQIAVQVVMMLAEQMGISGAQPASPAPSGGMGAAPPVPMGRNGMTVTRPKLF